MAFIKKEDREELKKVQITSVPKIDSEENLEVYSEIVGGLKSAIDRGSDLKEAMMSFYRAGYNKMEIEKAAQIYLDTLSQGDFERNLAKGKLVKKEEIEESLPQVKEIKKENYEKPLEKEKIIPKQENIPINEKKVIQNVSSYGSNPKESSQGKALTIVLVIILIVLLGLLTSVILFKSALVEFFNSLFG